MDTISRAGFLRLIARCPPRISDRLFASWSDEDRLIILYKAFLADHPLALPLRDFCLKQMSLKHCHIVRDMDSHAGIAVPTLRGSKMELMAAVHFSKLAVLLNLRIEGNIVFNNLSSRACRTALQYLRAHVKMVKCNEMRLILNGCHFDVRDLNNFVGGQNDQSCIFTIEFRNDCRPIHGIVDLVQNVRCRSILLHSFDKIIPVVSKTSG